MYSYKGQPVFPDHTISGKVDPCIKSIRHVHMNLTLGACRRNASSGTAWKPFTNWPGSLLEGVWTLSRNSKMKANLNMAQEALVGLLLLATPRTSCRLSDPAACHRPVSFKQTPQTEPQTKTGECQLVTGYAQVNSSRCRWYQTLGGLTYATRFSELGSHWSKKSSASASSVTLF